MLRLARTLPYLGLAAALACSSEVDAPSDGGAGTPDAGDVTPEVDAGMVSGCPPLGNVLQAGTAPTKRGDGAAAYDGTCDRLFLFFGDAAEPRMCNPAAADFLGDGYTYDLATGQWAEIELAGGPTPMERVRPSGAWDSSRGRALVFGGRWRNGTSGPYTYLNDLWSFDPETRTWTELSPLDAPGAPSPRMNTIMVYDEVGDRVIVFAGGFTSGIEFNVDNETWAFDLSTNSWTEIAQGGIRPEPRLFHHAAFDTARNRLWIFGGGGRDSFTTADAIMNDTWSLDLATETWSQVPEAMTCTRDVNCGPGGACVDGVCNTPSARFKGAMVYDEGRDQLVLFGGHDATQLGNDNDLWTFDIANNRWSRVTAGDELNLVPCASNDECPSTRTCNVAFGFCEQFGFCDFAADFATFDPNSPERRESHLFVAAGNQAIMYGGRTDCGLVNDTWSLDLETMSWEELTPAFSGLTCYRSGRQDCDDPDARKCG